MQENKYIEYDINEAITNYISYIESLEESNSKYNKEKIKNGYKALENKDLQLEYLIDEFNSMLYKLEVDGRVTEYKKSDVTFYKKENDRLSKENDVLRAGYNVPNFNEQIEEYLGMLEKLRNKNMFTQKSINKCKTALDNVGLQEECVKHIVKDIMFKIKARNKALAEARQELEILKSEVN